MKTVGLFLAISFCTFHSLNLKAQKRSKNLEISVSQSFLLGRSNFSELNLGLGVIYWTDFKLSEEETTLENAVHPYNLLTNNIYGYPLIGVYGKAISVINEGDDLGTPLSLGLATDITFYQKENHLFSVRPRLGVGYFLNSPNRNDKASSVLNMNTQLGVYYTRQSKKQAFKIGLNIDYYTNGSITIPANNLAYVNLSLAYQLGPKLLPFFAHEREQFKKDNFLNEPKKMVLYVQAGSLTKQIPSSSKQYLGGNLSFGATKSFNPILALNGQLTYTYDPSIPDELAQYQTESNNGSRIGINVGPQFTYHRFNFISFIGVYAYKPDSVLDKRIFQRYQLAYALSKKLYLYGSILAHWNKTDATELGLGFNL